MNAPPAWLEAVARWLLRRRFPAEAAQEVGGDLAELWIERARSGRRDLRRAYVRDLAGVLARRRRVPSAGLDGRGPLPGEGAFLVIADFRHALRGFVRHPMFFSVTVFTLSLGIAASTTIFSVADRVLMRPLPYPDAASLYVIEEPPITFAGGRMDVAPGALELGVLSAAGMFAEGGVNLDGPTGPIRVPATLASPGFFTTMGVPPALGRYYSSAENVDGANDVVVISHGLWQRLGGERAILGSALPVNARPFRVLGVMPEGFTFPGRTDVWLPVFSDRQVTGQAFAPIAIGRLAPGVRATDAEASLDRYQAGRYPAGVDVSPTALVPLHDDLTAAVRPRVLLLATAVALLLVVSCSNVAGLLLSRVAGRQAEFVLRRALGGSRWRLTRQLLAESLLLSLVAGAIGASAAVVMTRAIPRLIDQPLPGLDTAVDGHLLIIALVTSIGTGVLFGLAPGLAASGLSAASVIRASATASGSRSWRAFRAALVVGQLAIAVVLLALTGSTVQTMLRLSRVDLGFGNPDATALEVTLPLERYGAPERATAFYREADERLRAVPGVTRVAATGVVPGDESVGVGLRLVPAGAESAGTEDMPFATLLHASPHYFETMGIRLVRGRGFAEQDAAGAPGVVVVSESEAQALWPNGEDPIGRLVEISGPREARYEVVGVVSDVRLSGPDSDRPMRQFYRPLLQAPPFGTMTFVIESRLPPGTVIPAVRAALADVDAALPVYDVMPIGDISARFLRAHRVTMALMASFAAFTLLLASVGLYGVMSQLVALRTREIGIRIALGADRRRLLRGIVGQGVRLAAIGVVAGLVAASLVSRLIASFLPTLDPLAWSTLGLDALVLLVVTVAATWLPARRAAAVDPLVALRE